MDDAQSCQRLAAEAEAVAGHVDILINNAAIAVFGPTAAIRESDFDACFAVKVKAPFYLVGALAPAMVASIGTAGSAVYAGSKAALNLLTKSWAAEYGPRGVRVNAVAPGPTATDHARAQFTDGGLDAMVHHTPARRVGTPAEIAEVIVYLASDAASSYTAQFCPPMADVPRFSAQ
jgi:NAD(P)-dependent dehydrogenase (short-subunit alcohol dehydrogenase family)